PEGEFDINLVVADEKDHMSNETAFFISSGSPNLTRRGLILGLSIGGGTLGMIAIVIWLKYGKKIPLLRREK
ncbi:MAG: hypothetical protein ACXAAM_06405, partial [Candidatus Heimdallarchaeaceae archaeon]